jgi:methionine-S-sulfoxide reductase
MIRKVILLATGLALLGSAAWSLLPPKRLVRSSEGLEKATFAGGCYWCMEPPFEKLDGVVSVVAGHAGAGVARREAVEIWFDPKQISYDELLQIFWRNIDPLDDQGQFCDRGSDYRSGVFVHGESQRAKAIQSKAEIERRMSIKVVTAILSDSTFERAGDYDQNYYRQHPVRYRFYRHNCGRDKRLHEVWR